MALPIARQAATCAASSGCVLSQFSTAARRSAGSSLSTNACSSSSVTGMFGSVIFVVQFLFLDHACCPYIPVTESFHPPQDHLLAVKRGLDVRARPRQARHH